MRISNPKGKRVLFPCPRCDAPITEDEYMSIPITEQRFYHCKKCGEIIKKPSRRD